MKLRGDIAERAILEIFLEFGVPERGRLSLKTFEQDWHRWRLRAEDLHEGLRQLEVRGWIALERESRKMYVVLTKEGYAHASVLPMRMTGLLDLLGRWSMIGQRARREQSKPAHGKGRRRADRISQHGSSAARRTTI